jgi:site-specific DNA-cytosine methylase
MNVLSLFDGISAGQVALDRAGIKVNKYFASEIDKHAINVTMANYPKTIQLGDVRDIDLNELPKIDLIIGGPECKTYSVAGKMNMDSLWQIELFKKCIDVLKPRYWLMENVKSKKEIVSIINEKMGAASWIINSSLFSAQNRERRYWTNINFNKNIIDKNIYLKDLSNDLPICLSSSGRGNGVIERRLSDNAKAHTLTATGYTKRAFSGFITKELQIRNFTRSELEALQTFPIGYTNSISENQARKALGNSWTVDVIAHIFGGME